MEENLVFNVAQLLKEPEGAVRHVDVVADLARLAPDLQPEGGAKTAVALSGPVQLIHVGEGVWANGRLHADVSLPCARCLEPVPTPFNIHLEEVFVATVDLLSGRAITPEEEDQALWIDEHHLLDLSEVLRQDVLVEIPMHVLCRSECRGLCPTCGKNLNEGPCGCASEPDARWAPLLKLLESSNA